MFGGTEFSRGQVIFHGAVFTRGQADFEGAVFSGGRVSFDDAWFSGGRVSFERAKFAGGTVDFRNPGDWSQQPEFDWEGTPPAGVMLTGSAGAAPRHEPGSAAPRQP